LGTQHIIEGCLTHHVKRLVHVSTPSLYFSHGNRLDVKETDSLADPFVNFYTSTKRQAELLLIEAHKAQGLPFVALRPRAIYGEGDNAIFPRLIEALKAGRLPVIGKGDNVVDMSYVENVVDALLLSAQADDHVLGQFYNITNGEPTRLWDTIFLICDQLGLERPSRHVSFKTLFRIAGVLEWTHRHLLGGKEPMLTQYGVGVLGNSQTLSIEAAKHDLGYEPRFSTEQGIERFLKWYQENG
jgi:nucleoside-diphosphate-sugar epimerase